MHSSIQEWQQVVAVRLFVIPQKLSQGGPLPVVPAQTQLNDAAATMIDHWWLRLSYHIG
jgi:hypothetical protein